MSNAFDIEAAKRGELVLLHSVIGEIVPVHFVGVDRHGTPVIQKETGAPFTMGETGRLRMAPKKIKVRYRDAVLKGDHGPFVSTCNKDQGPGPEQYEDWNSFIGWIHTDWQEAEVEQ